jgi:hypothetical protein
MGEIERLLRKYANAFPKKQKLKVKYCKNGHRHVTPTCNICHFRSMLQPTKLAKRQRKTK